MKLGAGNVPEQNASCPLSPDHPKSSEHMDARFPDNQLVALSHMHRVNPTRLGPRSYGSNRIFRQGYEFLEQRADGRPRAGLNFVSFQCDLERFTNIVTTGRWLNTVNFGGPDDIKEIPSIELAQVVAGGYYAVPPLPLDDDPFPGAEIFR
jgi:deferrochelatase/peroxidase EfeB